MKARRLHWQCLAESPCLFPFCRILEGDWKGCWQKGLVDRSLVLCVVENQRNFESGLGSSSLFQTQLLVHKYTALSSEIHRDHGIAAPFPPTRIQMDWKVIMHIFITNTLTISHPGTKLLKQQITHISIRDGNAFVGK